MHAAAGTAHGILCSAGVRSRILALWTEGGLGQQLPLHLAWATTSLETHCPEGPMAISSQRNRVTFPDSTAS